MKQKDHHNIKIDKSGEPRKKEISRMIDEGGLGADKYYDIKKRPADENKDDELKQ